MWYSRRWVFDKTYPGVANLIICQGLVEGDLQDPKKFTLTLRVCVPPTTGFLMYYWHSPTVVIDQYWGDYHDKLSPEWLETVQTERRFWQNRTLMLEMMLYFVRNIPHNSGVSKRVTSWCRAMSVSNIFWVGRVATYKYSKIPASDLLSIRLLSIRPLPYCYPISPCNTHRYKPRASDMSAEELQKLRKTLNEGSPSRRRK